jgi:hypothetical protein
MYWNRLIKWQANEYVNIYKNAVFIVFPFNYYVLFIYILISMPFGYIMGLSESYSFITGFELWMVK